MAERPRIGEVWWVERWPGEPGELPHSGHFEVRRVTRAAVTLAAWSFTRWHYNKRPPREFEVPLDAFRVNFRRVVNAKGRLTRRAGDSYTRRAARKWAITKGR